MYKIAFWAALAVALISTRAGAQTCGPDTAPPQAAAQGYTCETFRWGSGDTTSGEIDTAQTYAAGCASPGLSPCGGFKLYYNNGIIGGQPHMTVGSDFTVVAGSGQIQIQGSAPGSPPSFLLNTCGGALGNTSWQVGHFFTGGWYVEYVGEWDITGHSGGNTGFFGLDQFQTTLNWEVDNPDAYANDQVAVFWGGGSSQSINNLSHTRFGDLTTQTGIPFGVMLTPSALTWWYNNVANGSADFAGSFGGIFNAGQMISRKFCFGPTIAASFPQKLDSIKIWQTGGSPPPPAGAARLLHK